MKHENKNNMTFILLKKYFVLFLPSSLFLDPYYLLMLVFKGQMFLFLVLFWPVFPSFNKI